MSKRVFCAFDRDEIEGYLNGGLPVEVLAWNPDPEAKEGVVESVLKRILDGVTYPWMYGGPSSVEIPECGVAVIIGSYPDGSTERIVVEQSLISGKRLVYMDRAAGNVEREPFRGWPPAWRYPTHEEQMQRLRDWNDAWAKIDE